jgi:replication factor C small subunit
MGTNFYSKEFMMLDLWVEAYRPKTLKEMVGQEEVVRRLEGFLEKKSLPNMIFAGPPGVGKTTAALCLARELYGDGWRDNLLELNASDERKIETIRTKVKEYARSRPVSGAPYKLLLLDEADALTNDAQHALRRMMEMYASTCRFILDCNYLSRIIEPIQSRCAVFRFARLTDEDIKKMLQRIAKEEKLTLQPEALEAIIYVSEGDMRRAINILQAAASVSPKITEKSVYDVTSRARPEEVREMAELALSGKFEEARNKLYQLLMERGLAGEDILDQLHREIFNLEVPETVKINLLEKLGEADFRLTEGGNERIQLEALLAHFVLVGSRLK